MPEDPAPLPDGLDDPRESLFDVYLDAALRGNLEDPDEFCRRHDSGSDEVAVLLKGLHHLLVDAPERQVSGAPHLPADEGLPLERCGGFRLMQEASLQLLAFNSFPAEELQGHRAVGPLLYRFVDHTHAAAGDQPPNGVVADALGQRRSLALLIDRIRNVVRIRAMHPKRNRRANKDNREFLVKHFNSPFALFWFFCAASIGATGTDSLAVSGSITAIAESNCQNTVY